MTVKFDFQGGRELDAALAEFSRPMAKAVGLRALKIAAEPIHRVAKALAPVRPANVAKFYNRNGAETLRIVGTLKHLVQMGTRLTKRQARLNRKMGKSEVEIHVGSRDPIARLIENGTRETPAHPFLRPAWDAEGNERALGRIADALWADIEKTAARVARRAAKKG